MKEGHVKNYFPFILSREEVIENASKADKMKINVISGQLLQVY